MRLNQLATVNTMFQPKKNSSVSTFLQTEPQGGDSQANDFGKYIGSKVKVTYRGKSIPGVVTRAYSNDKGHMRWTLQSKTAMSSTVRENDSKTCLSTPAGNKLAGNLIIY